jgi:hypothetical protein
MPDDVFSGFNTVRCDIFVENARTPTPVSIFWFSAARLGELETAQTNVGPDHSRPEAAPLKTKKVMDGSRFLQRCHPSGVVKRQTQMKMANQRVQRY